MARPYIGIVHKDPDSAWGISFPDAPGCFSAADEIDDLFANAEEALGLWLEAMREDVTPLPRVRALSEIERDEWWRESMKDAALVIAVKIIAAAMEPA